MQASVCFNDREWAGWKTYSRGYFSRANAHSDFSGVFLEAYGSKSTTYSSAQRIERDYLILMVRRLEWNHSGADAKDSEAHCLILERVETKIKNLYRCVGYLQPYSNIDVLISWTEKTLKII